MAISTICSATGCGKASRTKGYCQAHYARWRRYGDPLAGRTVEGEPLAYLLSQVVPHQGDDCLIWPYSRTSAGYGMVYDGQRMQVVSRLACERVHGPAPTIGHEAAHSCGNGHLGCVNPHHVGWKTAVENQRDKIIHDTHNRGERHGAAKLTEGAVIEIRRLRGIERQVDLAARFGVSQVMIGKIQRREKWTSV